MDVISGEGHSTRDIGLFKSLINDFELHDVWRLFNPMVKAYTWSKNNPFIARRLDFILCNNSLNSKILNVEHLFLAWSDHKAVTITIRISNFVRGPGIWRFNNSLLKDQNYITSINALIQKSQSNSSINCPILRWGVDKSWNQIFNNTILYTQKAKSLLWRKTLKTWNCPHFWIFDP